MSYIYKYSIPNNRTETHVEVYEDKIVKKNPEETLYYQDIVDWTLRESLINNYIPDKFIFILKKQYKFPIFGPKMYKEFHLDIPKDKELVTKLYNHFETNIGKENKDLKDFISGIDYHRYHLWVPKDSKHWYWFGYRREDNFSARFILLLLVTIVMLLTFYLARSIM